MLLHESGESIELKGYGHGVDPQDKSAGKATTYALKNCLLYTFLTPVGKIDDADTTHSNDIPVPQPKIKPVTMASPVLTDKGYEFLMAKGTVEQINEALAGRQMDADQEKNLTANRNGLKTKSK